MPPDSHNRYDSLFAYFGELHDVPEKLLKAQAYTESGLNPKAVSPVGAKGLAQFMDPTWVQYGTGDVFNPEQNIEAQARFMNHLLTKYQDDIRLALAAYNWGEGHVDRLGDECAPKETRDYVKKVMDLFLSAASTA